MPLNHKLSELADRDHPNPDAQSRVNKVTELPVNEGFSDESEDDEYDNEEKPVSSDPFSYAPRMPPYDFAKRKLSQLIGVVPISPKVLCHED